MTNSKDPIKLRRRLMPSGVTSLYLDIYLKGKRRYEYLKLYLIPERNNKDRAKNKETLRLAEDVRAMRMVALRNREFGFKSEDKEQTLFYTFFQSLIDAHDKGDGVKSVDRWVAAYQHLRLYDDNDFLTFRDITPEWVLGFKNYLEKKAKTMKKNPQPLAVNTQFLYFSKLRACINKALEEKIITESPIANIPNIKAEESKRMYLTIEEVKRLADTECRSEVVKRAFLFSCLTGLRISDIQKLTWGEVHHQGAFTRLIFKQKKTGGQEYLDISPQAAELMGGGGKRSEDKVFAGLPLSTKANIVIRPWVEKAGINKRITFHCARHTFAVMMLELGTEIYTVSKLLGHRLLNTTQVYAKILDKSKQEAVMRIPSIIAK